MNALTKPQIFSTRSRQPLEGVDYHQCRCGNTAYNKVPMANAKGFMWICPAGHSVNVWSCKVGEQK